MAPPAEVTAGTVPTSLVCAGCGYRVPAGWPVVLRCPAARHDDDIDHVLRRELDVTRIRFPDDPSLNPFIRYRTLFHGYHVARSLGWTDAQVTAFIERLDEVIADVDGHGFRVTPFLAGTGLDEALGFEPPGGVLVKDETGNVSGSHKARHLFGTLLELELAGGADDRPLAIASCGNAALAAAIVARAAGRRIVVFIPVDADPAVVARLRSLDALLEICERHPGMSGDPTYHRLLAALAGGAIGFTCQGNLNGLAIEGGETLGYELVDDLRTSGKPLDRIVVQVGGGALASACSQALAEARALGVLPSMPRIHTVQTRGAFPLERAYRRVVDRLVERLGIADVDAADLPDRLRLLMHTRDARDELAWIARHRSGFMWAWGAEPHSVATGILDDETYDWLAVVTAMLETGGSPLVVDEPTLVEANLLATRTTGIDVDATGSAGLAGLLALRRSGAVAPTESVAVLFTGIRRSGDAAEASPTSIQPPTE